MPREHARRSSIDSLAVGDIAFLVLVGRRRGAREPDRMPTARLQGPDEFGADAG